MAVALGVLASLWLQASSAALGQAPQPGAEAGAEARAEADAKATTGGTITFSNLVLRPGQGSFIGIANDELRLLMIETMRHEGFEARGGESLVFARDESNKADFVIGGTVVEAKCDGPKPDCCQIGVRWELLDSRRDEVVYRQLGRYGECYLSHLKDGEVYRRLTIGALRKVLHRKAFQQRLEAGARTATDAVYKPAKFAQCQRGDARVSKHSDRSLDATVIVRSGPGHGSGFVLSSEGLVLTAAHVLSGNETQVETRDGVSYRAHPIRISHEFDAALLRVELPSAWPAKKCLPIQPQANPGQSVYAIGAPASESLGFSITRGIVSGLRQIDGVRLIQTDAPISPGNSGGPLVDDNGRVLALVVSKLAGGAVEGIAFGTPIQVALGALGLGADAACDKALLSAPPIATSAASADVVADADDPVPVLKRGRGGPLRSSGSGARVRKHRDAKTKGELLQGIFYLGSLELTVLGAPKHPTASNEASVRVREVSGGDLGCKQFELIINDRTYEPLRRSVQKKKSGPLGKRERVTLLEDRYAIATLARVREHAPSIVVRLCKRGWTLTASQLKVLRQWLHEYEQLKGK